MTRDIGTQSTPPNEMISSGSPSPAHTPSIQESPRKLNSPLPNEKFNSAETVSIYIYIYGNQLMHGRRAIEVLV